MRIPDALASLTDYGIIDEVVRPLMSGKEAQVYLVRLGEEQRVAKVYKEAQNRTFKNRADYVEGRKVRNSRDQRAMGKDSRHGRAQAEAAWRTTEVDMIYRLHAAGVRVPQPYNFLDGVLVMEMITDERGEPAPRLGDVQFDGEGAQAVFDHLLAEVVRMLAAGVVHGDLSDFNVLMGTDGPVIIDFPQAVDASGNRNARKLLLRDVDNLHRYTARFVPGRRALPYAQEMWALYERGELTPDTKLTGRHQVVEQTIDTASVLGLIGDANRDERRRREQLGLSMRGADEAPARPLSRYAQKREEKVAARKLEAANQPPAPAPQRGQRDVRGNAQHAKARPRPQDHATATSFGSRADTRASSGSRADPRASSGSRADTRASTRAQQARPDHAKAQHASGGHGAAAARGTHATSLSGSRADPRASSGSRADTRASTGSRADPRASTHTKPAHAKPHAGAHAKAAAPRAQHPPSKHARQQHAGAQAGGASRSGKNASSRT